MAYYAVARAGDRVSVERFQVVRVRGDELGILCPWHQDKQPSLYLNLEKDKANCFAGCYRGTAKGAFEKLLGRKMTRKEELSGYTEFLEVSASNNYRRQYQIPRGDVSKWGGKAYLYNRGFTDSTIWAWDIGYDPERRTVSIPARRRNGTTVGTIYRHIDADVKPKYVYTTGLPISRMLFGTHKFDPFPAPFVYVVEGSLDCIWLWQCGFRSVVALLGLHMSLVQQQILRRLGDTVVLCLDNDKPGQDAVQRLAPRIEAGGQRVRIPTLLSHHKDVQEHTGLELQEVLENPRSYLSWKLLTLKS